MVKACQDEGVSTAPLMTRRGEHQYIAADNVGLVHIQVVLGCLVTF